MVDSTEQALIDIQKQLPDDLALQEQFEVFLKIYKKKARRTDKIFKQSDRQQHILIELNNKISQQKEELHQLHSYNIEQQNIAKEKLETTIANEIEETSHLKADVIYHPSDILSGDFYSIFKLKDGSFLVYILDGQGHGISPALTIFAVASTIASLVSVVENFEELIQKLFPMIQKFLGEIEQLSFIMLNIDCNQETLAYSAGGTYPVFVKLQEEILTLKSNNLPFMNFSPTPKITTHSIAGWESFILYTDGLVEEIEEELSEFKPIALLENDELFHKAYETIIQNSYEDDVTILKISKKG